MRQVREKLKNQSTQSLSVNRLITLSSGIHKWIPISDFSYECANCKIKATIWTNTEVLETNYAYPFSLTKNCKPETKINMELYKKSSPFWLNHRIAIKQNFYSSKPKYANCTPFSVHRIVEPPEGKLNGIKGMWIMGVGKRVFIKYNDMYLMPGIGNVQKKPKRTTAPVKFIRTKSSKPIRTKINKLKRTK